MHDVIKVGTLEGTPANDVRQLILIWFCTCFWQKVFSTYMIHY